jgi:predicted nuclease with TOPRIM domain
VTKKDKDDIAHVFSLVVEDLRSDIRQVAEGVGFLNERFDSLEGRFDRLEVRFDKLEVRFDELEVKVDRLDRDLSGQIRGLAASQAELSTRVEHWEARRD